MSERGPVDSPKAASPRDPSAGPARRGPFQLLPGPPSRSTSQARSTQTRPCPQIGPSPPYSPLPRPQDRSQPGPHRTVAGSFGPGQCMRHRPSGLLPPPLEGSGPLRGPRQIRAAAGPAPFAGLPGSGTARASASHSPHLYRARRLRNPLPLLKPFLLPAVPTAPPPFQTTHPSALHLPVGSHGSWSIPLSMNRYV